MSEDINKEAGKIAQQVHRRFFKDCKKAIEDGYYLEALFLEYAAIEDRMRVIFRELQMPCSVCEDTSIIYEIGLNQKLNCLKAFLSNKKNYPNILEKSKLEPATIRKMKEWCLSRNTRIHRLYREPAKYEKLKNKNEKYARQGLEFASLMYNEANRLKRLRKYHPEYFEELSFLCQPDTDGKLKSMCIQAKQWKPEEEKGTL